MMNQNNGGEYYEQLLTDVSRVITYIKENPKEFKTFCQMHCPCREECGATVKADLDEARTKCPIYGSEDPVADFDKQFKLALIKGDL